MKEISCVSWEVKGVGTSARARGGLTHGPRASLEIRPLACKW